MQAFSTKKRYRLIELRTSADIVQYSFLVQYSLDPLNLELSKSYNVFDRRTNRNNASFSFSKDFINTEEKCRKILSQNRRIMYILHLDLPRDTERSLKKYSGYMELIRDWEVPYLGKIDIREGFYVDIIYNLIHYVCTRNKNNLKVLKWFLNFDAVDRSLFDQLPCSIINYFLESMHFELDDFEFVMNCLKKIDIIRWLISVHSFKPERFENYLYQVHRCARKQRCLCMHNGEFIDFCISLSSYQITRNVLKLKTAPVFSDNLFYFYVDKISYARDTFHSVKVLSVSIRRRTLLLQVFWISIIKSTNPEKEIEFLSLIWRSVSDSFLSLGEITEAFEEGFTSEEITDVCNFYSMVVGKLHPNATPRSLKHYSRTAVRRILSENENWIPEGVEELPLPIQLKSYLNLEE